MLPDAFFSELWREFVHGLEGNTYISRDEMDSFFNNIYVRALKLYKSRHFEYINEEEHDWIENHALKEKNEAKRIIIQKAEKENILVPHVNEWVVHKDNTSIEKKATTWEQVGHNWDKRTGF